MRYFLLLTFVLSALLTVVVIRETKQILKQDTKPAVLSEQTSQTTATPSAILYFSEPSKTYSNLNVPITTDILINSGNVDVSEIQIELKYNPVALSSVKASVPEQSFLGNRENFTVAFNEVDSSLGRVSLALKIRPTGLPKKGIGKVATLSFTPHSSSTLISFTPASSVTSPNWPASILNKTFNTTITYKPVSTSSAQFAPFPLQ